jgi:AraC-like DNA-binding protein
VTGDAERERSARPSSNRGQSVHDAPASGGADRPLIVALVLDPLERAIFQTALAPVGRVHTVDRLAALAGATRSTPPTAVISELFDADGRRTLPVLEEIARRVPEVGIVIYVVPTVRALHELVRVGEHLPNGWVAIRGVDDILGAIRAALERARSARAVRVILDVTLPLVPPLFHPLVRYCAHAAVGPIALPAAIRASGLSRRTLYKRLREHGLPSLERLIQWHRVLHAAWRLDTYALPLKRVAADLGFHSAAALRKAYRSCLGHSPGEVGRRGAMSYLLARYATALRGTASPPQDPDAANGAPPLA